MNYCFDKIIERIGTNSQKWDSEQDYQKGKVIPMWVADMDFPVAEPIIKAISKRLEHPIFGYAIKGDDFFSSVVRWMRKRHQWNVDNSWIVSTPGVVPAISFAIQAFTEPGDSVIIQTPVYYPFEATIKACSRKTVINPLLFDGTHYKMDLDDFDNKVKQNHVKMFILCNPHNPVGRVYTYEELSKIGEICLQNGIKIFSDEIHSDLIFSGYKHIPIASISEELSNITLTGISPSKSFNIAGLMTAVVICQNDNLRRTFESVTIRNGVQFVNTFGREALKAAYTEGDEYLEQLLRYLEKNVEYAIDYFEKNLKPLKLVKPEGTYLLWVDCRELRMSSAELDNFIYNQARLSFDDGRMFGECGEGFTRINVACSQTILEKALNQLKGALDLLKN